MRCSRDQKSTFSKEYGRSLSYPEGERWRRCWEAKGCLHAEAAPIVNTQRTWADNELPVLPRVGGAAEPHAPPARRQKAVADHRGDRSARRACSWKLVLLLTIGRVVGAGRRVARNGNFSSTIRTYPITLLVGTGTGSAAAPTCETSRSLLHPRAVRGSQTTRPRISCAWACQGGLGAAELVKQGSDIYMR